MSSHLEHAYCAECGTRWDSDARFCGACGALRAQSTAGSDAKPLNVSSVAAQLGSLRIHMSGTGWLVLIGAALSALAPFFAWAMGTLGDGLGGTVGSETLRPAGPGRFIMVAFAVGVVALAWPALSEGRFSKRRIIGLTVVTSVLTLFVISLIGVALNNAKHLGLSHTNVAFGAALAGAGLVAIWIAVVRVWTRQLHRQAER